jgi:signal peptidase I
MRNLTRDLVLTLVAAIVIFLLLRFVLGSFTVVGESMEPGLQKGQVLLIFKLAYQFSPPDRGDVVYYRTPEGDSSQLKRVIGLPGDVLDIRDGAVYINHTRLAEPYLKEQPNYDLPAFQVPPQSYFILGDNRNHSSDSSSGWTVPQENILGRAWIITWPPSKWGSAGNYPLDARLVSSSAP